ncbi:MAG TPA: FkbM family methyltransferase [Kiritimatiellia bacterium]|nr:FkbM family methyltransferase [Kiritimatiellia bacterium]
MVARFTADRWPPADAVRRLVKPGAVVVDAGANVGYVTALLASWVGPAGRVHSFEPVPQTAELLERAVRRLGLVQVILHRCGVSDHHGEARMVIPRYGDGGENLYESRVLAAGESGADGVEVTIPLRRMDDELSADAPRIAFMKIDVEGHEQAALAGAERVLAESRPVLLVEIMGDLDAAGTPANRVVNWLAERGYRPFFWEGAWRERRHGESAVDYFFLMPHHTERSP